MSAHDLTPHEQNALLFALQLLDAWEPNYSREDKFEIARKLGLERELREAIRKEDQEQEDFIAFIERGDAGAAKRHNRRLEDHAIRHAETAAARAIRKAGVR